MPPNVTEFTLMFGENGTYAAGAGPGSEAGARGGPPALACTVADRSGMTRTAKTSTATSPEPPPPMDLTGGTRNGGPDLNVSRTPGRGGAVAPSRGAATRRTREPFYADPAMASARWRTWWRTRRPSP